MVETGGEVVPVLDGPEGVAVADCEPVPVLVVVVALVDVVPFKAAQIFAGIAPNASKYKISQFEDDKDLKTEGDKPCNSEGVQVEFAKHGGIKVAS